MSTRLTPIVAIVVAAAMVCPLTAGDQLLESILTTGSLRIR